MSLSHSRPGLADFPSDFYDSELFNIIAMQLEECISSGSDSSIPAVAAPKPAPTFLGPYRLRPAGVVGAFAAASPAAKGEEEEKDPIMAAGRAVEEEEKHIVAPGSAPEEEEDEEDELIAAVTPTAKGEKEKPVIPLGPCGPHRFARPVVEEDEDDEDYNDHDSRIPASSRKRKKPPVGSPAVLDPSHRRKKLLDHRRVVPNPSPRKKKPLDRRRVVPDPSHKREKPLDRRPAVPGARRKTPCLGCIRSLLVGKATAPCHETTRPDGNRCFLCDAGHKCQEPPLALRIPGRRLQTAFFAKDKKWIKMWRVTCRTLLSEYDSGRPDSDPCDEDEYKESDPRRPDPCYEGGNEESHRPEPDHCNEDMNEISESESRFSLDELGL